MRVVDAIGDAERSRPSRKKAEALVIHRVGRDLVTGADLGATGFEVARAFREDPDVAKYTGGCVPYHFIVDPGGKIWQLLPLRARGVHARVWNPKSVAVAFLGDFRHEPPTRAQLLRGRWLAWTLLRALSLPVEAVQAHDALPGGTKDPNKECPGSLFDLDAFRRSLASGLVL